MGYSATWEANSGNPTFPHTRMPPPCPISVDMPHRSLHDLQTVGHWHWAGALAALVATELAVLLAQCWENALWHICNTHHWWSAKSESSGLGSISLAWIFHSLRLLNSPPNLSATHKTPYVILFFPMCPCYMCLTCMNTEAQTGLGNNSNLFSPA